MTDTPAGIKAMTDLEFAEYLEKEALALNSSNSLQAATEYHEAAKRILAMATPQGVALEKGRIAMDLVDAREEPPVRHRIAHFEFDELHVLRSFIGRQTLDSVSYDEGSVVHRLLRSLNTFLR